LHPGKLKSYFEAKESLIEKQMLNGASPPMMLLDILPVTKKRKRHHNLSAVFFLKQPSKNIFAPIKKVFRKVQDSGLILNMQLQTF